MYTNAAFLFDICTKMPAQEVWYAIFITGTYQESIHVIWGCNHYWITGELLIQKNCKAKVFILKRLNQGKVLKTEYIQTEYICSDCQSIIDTGQTLKVWPVSMMDLNFFTGSEVSSK